VGTAGVKREVWGRKQHLEGERQSEEFCFHTEESAQCSIEEIGFEDGVEAPSNQM
jgi:hypothetical protein